MCFFLQSFGDEDQRLVFFIQQSSVVVLERASNNRTKKKDSLDLLVHYQIAAWEQKKEISHEWNGEDLLRLLASWKSHPNLFFRWFPLLRAFLLLHRKNFAVRRL